jgi:formamidopyrimidine-DNA glycosylase
MPELPEVETVRLGLAPVLEGYHLTDVQTRRGDLRIPFPQDFIARIKGRKVIALRRRAKYLLADLDSGETLVIHLGMSGRMSVFSQGIRRRIGNYVYDKAPADAGCGKHDHVIFQTDAPARIIFTDHRRFGLMSLVNTERLGEDKLFKSIGVEPLSAGFNVAYLKNALAGKRTPIKSALLDQRLVAGLGNIYVCEALFRSRISPKRLAGSIKGAQVAMLATAIKKVLKDAIAAGGSTLRDHAQATGDPGNFQHHFLVYGRQGKPCKLGCEGLVKRMVQSGRSTFYCPKCQK